MKKLRLMFLLILMAGVLTGCAVPSYDVEVYLSPKFKEQMKVYPSLEVDVVGVNANERERFASCRLDDYFQIDNALRSGTDHFTLYFSEDDIVPKRLQSGNPVWSKFGKKDADRLYLLVNIPAIGTKSDETTDGRRIEISLERTGLFGNRRRCFEITPAGIVLLRECPAGYPEPKNTENRKEKVK